MSQDPGVVSLCYLSWTLWMLGYLDQGMRTANRLLELTRSLGHPFILAFALHFNVAIRTFCRDLREARQLGEIAGERGFQFWAESKLRKAIDVARRQQARIWELRGAVALCRLLVEQGRGDEGREMLASIFGWFTEGFDFPDLQEAHAILSHTEAMPISA